MVDSGLAPPLNQSIGLCNGTRQTLDKVGVYLTMPVFSHGQFCVVVSRVTSRKGLKILALDENRESTADTRNIVYHEVLANL